MTDFELLQPRTLADALGALKQTTTLLRPLAGGTDMIVDLRSKRARADVLVSLQNLTELQGITRTNGTLKIGAATRVAEFLKHPVLVEHDALRQAAFLFANPMIRNLATLAGNIGSASPAGDMLPPLLAFDAQIELVSENGTRTLPLEEFFLGPRKTAKRADELISSIQLSVGSNQWQSNTIASVNSNQSPVSSLQSPVSNLQSRTSSSFYKLGLRQADAISLVSVAVWLERDGEKIREVRIALGAVAPRPMRAVRAEEILRGQLFNETNVAQAAQVASQECSPIDDLRATATYRRRMIGVYVRRMVEQAWSKTQ